MQQVEYESGNLDILYDDGGYLDDSESDSDTSDTKILEKLGPSRKRRRSGLSLLDKKNMLFYFFRENFTSPLKHPSNCWIATQWLRQSLRNHCAMIANDCAMIANDCQWLQMIANDCKWLPMIAQRLRNDCAMIAQR